MLAVATYISFTKRCGYYYYIVPAAGCTYPELLFRHKNLDYFQEKDNEKKKKEGAPE